MYTHNWMLSIFILFLWLVYLFKTGSGALWLNTKKERLDRYWLSRGVSMPLTLLGSLYQCASIRGQWAQAPRQVLPSRMLGSVLALVDRALDYRDGKLHIV